MGMTPVPEPAGGAKGAALGANGATAETVGVRPARGLGATLLGVGTEVVAAAVASARAATASLAEADQRTAQGFSNDAPRAVASPPSQSTGRRDTQQGVFSAAPGVASAAVKEARVKAISGSPAPIAASVSAVASSYDATPSAESRTTWEEIPSDLGRKRDSGPAYAAVPVSDDWIPKAVLVDEPAYASVAPPSSYGAADETWRQRTATPFSNAPPEMRDVTAFESRRPGRPIPWQYVGLGVLTAIAYVAWLYLLDHF